MKYFILLLFCLASSLGQAQEFKRFTFALKAGGGWGGWYTHPAYMVNRDLRPGEEEGPRFVSAYAAGVKSSYHLTRRFSTHLDVLYVSGGSRTIRNSQGIHYSRGVPFENIDEQTLRINTIRTPLSLTWDVTKGSIRPFISMGASFNWIVGGHRNVYFYQSTAGETRDENQPLRLDIASNRDIRYDWSFYSGIGLNVNDRLLVEANLWLGPSRVYTYSKIDPAFYHPLVDYAPPTDLSYHNRAIMISLAYLLVGG